jgi:glycosyltransferase involved in cell wall biosynthesis
MRILVGGGTDVPPPYGGLARRILHNCAQWEQRHQVTLLLRWKKPNEDYMGATRTRVRHVYSFQPEEGSRRDNLLRERLLPALRVLATRPGLAGTITRQRELLYTGKRGLKRLSALADDLNYAAALDDAIREDGIEVIQSHYARQETFVTQLVAARHGIPVVMTTYAEAVVWPEEGEKITQQALYGAMPEWDPLFRQTFNRSAYVIAPSWHCAQGPLRFIPKERVVVAYAGIDAEAIIANRQHRDEYRRELGVADDKVILYVGQITPRKGPQYLAQAMPEVLKREPKARAVFIGSDLGYLDELKALCEPFKDRVTFTGGISTEKLLKYYGAGDVLAFPTATDRECMGMSMKEAMAAGTPVVVFRAGGAPEAVEPGVTGYVVEVGDTAALADRLVACLNGQGSAMRDACVRRARALFDVRSTAAQEEAVLERALCEARQRRGRR